MVEELLWLRGRKVIKQAELILKLAETDNTIARFRMQRAIRICDEAKAEIHRRLGIDNLNNPV